MWIINIYNNNVKVDNNKVDKLFLCVIVRGIKCKLHNSGRLVFGFTRNFYKDYIVTNKIYFLFFGIYIPSSNLNAYQQLFLKNVFPLTYTCLDRILE